MKLRIGVDFDNTLIDYRELFYRLATENGRALLPVGHSPARFKDKELIRQTLIDADGHDLRWQQLQAEAYGTRIAEAPAFEGVHEFFAAARSSGHEIFVISHKTEFSKFAPEVSLREAAERWLASSRLDLAKHNLRFEPTQDSKIGALRELACDIMIDDLRELLVRRDFPPQTLPLWFAPQGGKAGVPLSFSNWSEILSFVSYCASPSNRPVRAHALENSGNSRLYSLTCEGGTHRILKKYPAPTRDFATCEFLWGKGFRDIPHPLWQDAIGRFAIYSQIDGARPVVATPVLVDQAVAFMGRLHDLSGCRDLPEFSLAVDGRECLGDYLGSLERRRARIELNPQGRQFFDSLISPLWERVVAKFREDLHSFGASLDTPFAPQSRCLSPSDFGLHNMLIAPGREPVFLDFEYFGWDDPAKLAADFFHSRAQQVDWDLKWRFLDGLARQLPESGEFMRRWEWVVDLIGLEWVLIVLNVFDPEKMTRKKFANPGIIEEDLILERTQRAATMLKDYAGYAAQGGKFLTIPDRATSARLGHP